MYTRVVKQHMLIRTAEPEGVWDPTLVEGKQARYQHLNDSTLATPELYKEATSRRQPPETHGSLLQEATSGIILSQKLRQWRKFCVKSLCYPRLETLLTSNFLKRPAS